jgi:hypothetical protein
MSAMGILQHSVLDRLLGVSTGKAEKERAGNMYPAPFESGPFFLEAAFLTAWRRRAPLQP